MRRVERLRLVDEEAEAQVVAHERGDVGAQALAGAQPPEHGARELGAAHVVADERHAAVRATARVSGLAASCSSAPQRSAPPRVSSSASGSPAADGAARRRALRSSPSRPRAGSRRQRDRPARAPRACGRDVAVVKAALLDAAQRLELGQHDGGRAELAHQLERRAGPRRRDDPRAAPRRRARPRPRAAPGAASRACASVVASGSQVELDARGARAAARAAGRRANARGAGHAQPPRAQVARRRRAGRSAAPPSSGWAIALTVKSRRREVGLERLRRAAARRRSARRGRARPRARRRLLGQREARAPPARRAPARAPPAAGIAATTTSSVRAWRGRAARSRTAPPTQPGAPRPPARARRAPGLAAGERPLGRRRAPARRLVALAAGASPRCSRGRRRGGSRGTRGVIAARDLVVDRLEAPRELLGGDPLARPARRSASPARRAARGASALRAEVDGDVVHADGADEREARARDQHVGSCSTARAASRRRSRSAAPRSRCRARRRSGARSRRSRPRGRA